MTMPQHIQASLGCGEIDAMPPGIMRLHQSPKPQAAGATGLSRPIRFHYAGQAAP